MAQPVSYVAKLKEVKSTPQQAHNTAVIYQGRSVTLQPPPPSLPPGLRPPPGFEMYKPAPIHSHLNKEALRLRNWNQGIALAAHEGNFKKCYAIIERMKQEGVKRDVFSYSPFMKQFFEPPNPNGILELIDAMQKDGVVPDVGIYNSLLYVYANQGSVEGAKIVLNKIKVAGLLPNVQTYTMRIKLHLILNQEHEAWGVFNKMQGKGIAPTAVTYNTFIFYFSKMNHTRKLFDLVAKMKENGVALTASSYTMLIKHCLRHNWIDDARQFENEMKASCIQPTQETLATQFNLQLTLCDEKAGSELLEIMKEQNPKALVSSQNMLISRLLESDKLEEATQLLADMKKANTPQDAFSYTPFIQYHLRKNNEPRALQAFEEMRAEGILPSSATAVVLVSWYYHNNEIKKALHIFHKMIELHVEPDQYLLTLMFDMLLKAGNIDEAKKIYGTYCKQTLELCKDQSLNMIYIPVGQAFLALLFHIEQSNMLNPTLLTLASDDVRKAKRFLRLVNRYLPEFICRQEPNSTRYLVEKKSHSISQGAELG